MAGAVDDSTINIVEVIIIIIIIKVLQIRAARSRMYSAICVSCMSFPDMMMRFLLVICSFSCYIWWALVAQ